MDLVNGTSTYYNFDDFIWAFTTVFIILTAESWSYVWFAHYRAVNSIASTLYFYSLLIIGNKIILNIFLAILLSNFDEDSLDEELQNEI